MTRQHFNETYGLNAPENYERFFVPVIGEPVAKDLISIAALSTGIRVLDVACGTGIVARLASQQVGDTGTVTGLDINPGMLAVARSSTPPDMSIEWHEAPAEAMPLPDEAFDVVLCQMGLQFMEDKPGALEEMQRVLVPGGRLILNMPGPAGEVFISLAEAMEQYIGPEAAAFVNHVFSLHEINEIRQLVYDAGFYDTDIQRKNKMLSLPAPKDFLWQYVHSTPLVGSLSGVDEDTRNTLEGKVVEEWQKFVEDGAFMYQQRIVTVSAQK